MSDTPECCRKMQQEELVYAYGAATWRRDFFLSMLSHESPTSATLNGKPNSLALEYFKKLDKITFLLCSLRVAQRKTQFSINLDKSLRAALHGDDVIFNSLSTQEDADNKLLKLMGELAAASADLRVTHNNFYNFSVKVCKPLDAVRRSMQRVWLPLSSCVGKGGGGGGGGGGKVDDEKDEGVELFVSGKNPVAQAGILAYHGITHVLSCYAAGGKELVFEAQVSPSEVARDLLGGIKHKAIAAVDDESYDVSQNFEEAIEYIDAALNSACTSSCCTPRVLVHCSAGMHRCCTFAAVYFIHCLKRHKQQQQSTATTTTRSLCASAEEAKELVLQIQSIIQEQRPMCEVPEFWIPHLAKFAAA